MSDMGLDRLNHRREQKAQPMQLQMRVCAYWTGAQTNMGARLQAGVACSKAILQDGTQTIWNIAGQVQPESDRRMPGRCSVSCCTRLEEAC